MNNKITFCSYPDKTDQHDTIALKNYTNHTIKQILNLCEHDQTFYLIDKDVTNEWLNYIQKQVTITYDCSTNSVEKILNNGKK